MNKKLLLTLLSILFFWGNVSGQNIGDFFKMIPLRNYASPIGYLSVEQKDSLLRNGPQTEFVMPLTIENSFLLSALDYKNGYLSIQTDGPEYVEMCMWICHNYKETGIPAHIIAVAYTSPDTNGTSTDYLDIFLYRKNTLSLISNEFDQMQFQSNFFKEGVDYYKQKEYYNYLISYELPRQGRDMKMHINMPEGEGTDHNTILGLLFSIKADILNITLDEHGNFTKGELMKSEYFREINQINF